MNLLRGYVIAFVRQHTRLGGQARKGLMRVETHEESSGAGKATCFQADCRKGSLSLLKACIPVIAASKPMR